MTKRRRVCRWAILLLIAYFFYKLLAIHAFVLSLLSCLGLPVMPVFIDALGDGHETVRMVTVSCLARRGPEAIPALLQALEDTNERRREHAARALGQMTRARKDALPELRKQAAPALRAALEDDNPRVRVHAAIALWEITGEVEQVLPTLLACWADEDHQAKHWASMGMAKMGPKAKEAIPVLRQALEEKDDLARTWAEDALRCIQAE